MHTLRVCCFFGMLYSLTAKPSIISSYVPTYGTPWSHDSMSKIVLGIGAMGICLGGIACIYAWNSHKHIVSMTYKNVVLQQKIDAMKHTFNERTNNWSQQCTTLSEKLAHNNTPRTQHNVGKLNTVEDIVASTEESKQQFGEIANTYAHIQKENAELRAQITTVQNAHTTLNSSYLLLQNEHEKCQELQKQWQGTQKKSIEEAAICLKAQQKKYEALQYEYSEKDKNNAKKIKDQEVTIWSLENKNKKLNAESEPLRAQLASCQIQLEKKWNECDQLRIDYQAKLDQSTKQCTDLQRQYTQLTHTVRQACSNFPLADLQLDYNSTHDRYISVVLAMQKHLYRYQPYYTLYQTLCTIMDPTCGASITILDNHTAHIQKLCAWVKTMHEKTSSL
jgi:hypothetical protein